MRGEREHDVVLGAEWGTVRERKEGRKEGRVSASEPREGGG